MRTEVMQELHSATDYALWATKMMAQALGRVMSVSGPGVPYLAQPRRDVGYGESVLSLCPLPR